jgi:hypothetical protein
LLHSVLLNRLRALLTTAGKLSKCMCLVLLLLSLLYLSLISEQYCYRASLLLVLNLLLLLHLMLLQLLYSCLLLVCHVGLLDICCCLLKLLLL